MNQKSGGKASKRIAEIEKSGKFQKGISLSGCNEFVARLNDHERAMCAYMEEIIISGADIRSIKFQTEIVRGELWFSIIERLDLWEKPNNYAINNGESLVILDDDALREIIGSKTINASSIDDLPDEVRKMLTDLVLSSKSFGFRSNSSVN